MKKYHDIGDIHFENDEMIITIDDEQRRFPLSRISSELLNATNSEREKYEVSPGGYGIHWPDLDEDLSIDGLLGICHERKQKVMNM